MYLSLLINEELSINFVYKNALKLEIVQNSHINDKITR